jgi:hypothetical protein
LEILSQKIHNFLSAFQSNLILSRVLRVFRKVESVFTAARLPSISTSIASGRCIPRRESRLTERRSTAGPRTKSAPRPLSAYAESGGTVVGH